MRTALWKTVGPVLIGLLSMAGVMAAPGTASASTYADCQAGKSCYFTDANGSGDMWVAPSAGCWNLGNMNPPFNDRISSVWNRGGAVVHMYNWVGYWAWEADVQIGQQWTVYGGDSRNDVIDEVCIGRTP